MSSLPLYALVALFFPSPTWAFTARAIGKATRTLRLPWPYPTSAEMIESDLQVLREYAPWDWHPKLRVTGVGHLHDALDAGKGAILWNDTFVFGSLLSKRYLAEIGCPVAHLSRPEHGYSSTHFGIRWLNLIKVRSENRYLAKRIVIERGLETRSVRTAIEILGKNGIVSITAGAWEGRKRILAPVMGRQLPLATGAASIALATGAPLIPVTTVKEGPGERFLIHLAEPIETPRDLPKEAALRHIANAYGKRLEPWIRAYPSQWLGGYFLTG